MHAATRTNLERTQRPLVHGMCVFTQRRVVLFWNVVAAVAWPLDTEMRLRRLTNALPVSLGHAHVGYPPSLVLYRLSNCTRPDAQT